MSEIENSDHWFTEWFNTPYYQILYKHRDDNEAQFFMDNLLTHWSFPKNTKVLDAPCGTGRHSIYLNKKGFNVTGIDLSKTMITEAKPFICRKLKFDEHDMREVYKEESFDVVLNLFTSFGYFESGENQQTINAFSKSLKKGGTLLIDFMNVKKVLLGLVEEEIKTVEGIKFHINRFIDGNYIVKRIEFTDKGKQHKYCEKVKVITLSDFDTYLKKAGLTTVNLFGDYSLNDFDATKSDRLIIEARKI